MGKNFYFYIMMKSPKFIGIFLLTILIKPVQGQTVTWADDIAPILYKNCTSCHHFGGLAPNPFITYQDAFNERFYTQQYVNSKYMPPWPPDANYKHLANERILAPSDIAKISQWVLNGAPEGNPANAPAAPVYTNNATELTTINFTGIMQSYLVNTSSDLYRCFIINTNFATDVFASDLEVRPGNPAIVHHVLVYEDTSSIIVQRDSADAGPGYTNFYGTGSASSHLVGEWVPGTRHITFPSGMGVRLRKNTRIILQVHYPKGTYLKLDSTRVNITFALNSSSPLFREVYLAPILSDADFVNGPLSIPPNTIRTFTAASTPTVANLPFGAFSLLSIAPHMHLIGKQVKVFGLNNGNSSDTIPMISIPKWDFKWQGVYNFRNPLKIVEGTTLVAQSLYDNTSSNLNNPSIPPIQVNAGEATTDEMMLVFFAFTYYLPGDENIVIDNSPLDVGIQELQKNAANSLQIYNLFPNPAKNSAQLPYFSPTGNLATAKITSLDGRTIREWPLSLLQGYGSVPVNLEGLNKGQYFITIQSKSLTRTKSFIVYE